LHEIMPKHSLGCGRYEEELAEEITK
jgi:hypothetical protein